MNIKWTRQPIITGTSDEAPHLIFWKDKDGNVKSWLREVAQDAERAMNEMEQRGTQMVMPQEQINSLNINWTTTVMGQEGTCAAHPGLVFRRNSADEIFIDEALLERRSKDANRAINDEALALYTRMQRERLAEMTAEINQRPIDPAYRERR
jgi:hypothetical protein